MLSDDNLNSKLQFRLFPDFVEELFNEVQLKLFSEIPFNGPTVVLSPSPPVNSHGPTPESRVNPNPMVEVRKPVWPSSTTSTTTASSSTTSAVPTRSRQFVKLEEDERLTFSSTERFCRQTFLSTEII